VVSEPHHHADRDPADPEPVDPDPDPLELDSGSARGGARSAAGSPGAAGLDPQSDRWLVGKARDGDSDAWEVLIRRHRDRIFRIALRMLGNPDDAEDVAQDVAIQVWIAMAGFSGASSFTTWLYRIAINKCLNHQRRRRSTRPLVEADHPTAAGPEQTVLARGRAEAAAAALAALPNPLRSALVLHEMEGLSYPEVATILNVPESTVRGRIYRARRALLHDLREWS